MKRLIILLGILLFCSNLTLAQANCKETPPDDLSPLAALSLFNDNYRNGDYEFALKYGRWMTCAKPETLEGYSAFSLERQYEKLVKIYGEIAKIKADPAVRSAYIDTAITLLDESLEMFADDQESKFDIHLTRGRFFQSNYNLVDDGLSKAYSEYEEMFEINTERATQLGKGYYLRLVLSNMVKKNRKEDAQNLIDEVRPLVEGELLAFVEEQQQELLGSPEERIAYFEPIIENDPENIDALKALEGAYEATGNRAKLKEVKTKIHQLEPTFESAKSLADFENSNANYAQAAKYYQEALQLADDDATKKVLYLNVADALKNQGQLEQARQAARNALEIDPNFGQAYIRIAQIYADAVSRCTQDRKLEAKDKVVYWAVVDYLNKAKEVDSSVSSEVNRQLGTYEAVTPTTSDSFLTLNLEKGDQVKIDGSLNKCYSWINETVTVR